MTIKRKKTINPPPLPEGEPVKQWTLEDLEHNPYMLEWDDRVILPDGREDQILQCGHKWAMLRGTEKRYLLKDLRPIGSPPIRKQLELELTL